MSSEKQPTGSLLARHPWLIFVLPFAVYMLLGQLEPSPVDFNESVLASEPDAGPSSGFGQRYQYPAAYSLKLLLTTLSIAFVFPAYRAFPFRLHWHCVPIGLAGGLLWVLLCRLGLESTLWKLLRIGPMLESIGLQSWSQASTRPMFDPLTIFAENVLLLWVFVGIRFAGLVIVVPLIEEFFLRGFLVRWFGNPDWQAVPTGALTGAGMGVVLFYAAATHPGEWIAAMLWFGAVSLLVMRTRNIWDAVAVHLLTNLVLGIYIMAWRDWSMW